MTTKTDITLPPLPGALIDVETEARAYARAAVEADRQGRMPSDDEILACLRPLYSGDEVAAMGAADDLRTAHLLLFHFGSGQPAASAEPASAVNRETVIEWLDALDIEVTDKQLDGLFHAVPIAAPVAQEPVAGRDLLRRAKVVLELIDKDRGSTICAGGLVSDISTYLAAPVAAQAQQIHPAVREGVEAAFEQRPGWLKKIGAAVRYLPDVAAQAQPVVPAAWKGIALDAIRRMRAGHVNCMDIIDMAEKLLEAERGAFTRAAKERT
jgi:hypothetical protein